MRSEYRAKPQTDDGLTMAEAIAILVTLAALGVFGFGVVAV